MCGSGTLLAEALMHYCRIPSNYLRRRFGFERLPGYEASTWERVRKTANDAMREPPAGLIAGSDIQEPMVAIARANLANLPHGERVSVTRASFLDLQGLPNTTILTNPPYGRRLGRGRTAPELAKAFGDFLKQRCSGAAAFAYFGDRELIKSVGLKPGFKRPLKNGGLDGRLVRYDMY